MPNAKVAIRSEEEFDTLVLGSAEPVLAHFHADWCGPCRMIAPIVEQVMEETGIAVATINVDHVPALKARYSVQDVPQLILFKGGKRMSKKIGLQTKQVLLGWINEKIGPQTKQTLLD